MKKYLILGLFGLLTLNVVAQNSETRSVGSFDEIQVSQGIDAYLEKGSKESVRIEVDGIEISDVLTEVNGDRLKIHLKGVRYRSFSVSVYVTYVSLEEISASSAANVVGKNVIKTDRLTLDVSSAADINVSVEANEVTCDASSSGDIEVKGKAKYLDVDVSSAGSVDAFDFEVEEVRVDASSGADARVFATKEIVAEASSGASVRYKGNPMKSKSDTSSGGSVRKYN